MDGLVSSADSGDDSGGESGDDSGTQASSVGDGTDTGVDEPPPAETSDGDDTETGEPSTCGNGTVDADEECDDANADAADGCEVDCRVSPGTVLWSRSIDGGAGLDDHALAVAIDQAGTIYAVGYTGSDASESAWLGVFSPEGDLLREAVHSADAYENATSVLVLPDGTVRIAARSSSGASLLLREDAGALVELGEPGPAPAFWSPYLAAAPSGDLYRTQAWTTEDGVQQSLQRIDADGEIVWSRDLLLDALPESIVANADGDVAVVGNDFTSPNHSSLWTWRCDADGNTTFATTHDRGDFDNVWGGGSVLQDDGTLRVGGMREIPGFGLVAYLAEIDEAGALQDAPELELGAGTVILQAMVPHGDGLVFAGIARPVADPADAGVFAIDDGRALLWGVVHDGDLGFNDGAYGLAADAAGDLVAVGFDAVSDEEDNLWIAKVRG